MLGDGRSLPSMESPAVISKLYFTESLGRRFEGRELTNGLKNPT